MRVGNIRTGLSLAMLTALTLALATLAAPAVAGPRIVFVDAGAPGLNDGTSWENAHRSLTGGLTDATAGDEIWVAQGVYSPGTLPMHQYDMKSGVGLYGGFQGTQTSRDPRNPALFETLLTGGGVNRHVLWAHDLVAGTVVDGFTIAGGNADGAVGTADGDGAGINSANNAGTFANLIIEGNQATGDGGGIFHKQTGDAVLTIHDVVFRRNAGRIGGGLLMFLGGADLARVTFIGNVATEHGGGAEFFGTTGVVTDARVSGNRAKDGGGVGLLGKTPLLDRVLFEHNFATRDGGAVFTFGGGDRQIANATFSTNTALGKGGAVVARDAPFTLESSSFLGNRAAVGANSVKVEFSVTIRRRILHDGPGGIALEPMATATIEDSLVEGGCPTTVTCTNVSSADPKLGPLADNGGPTRTHALLAGSPAIDAAASCGTVLVDQRGVKRPVDGDAVAGAKCDYGAYELTPALPLPRYWGRLSTIARTPENDSITGKNGPDVILTFGGNDTVDGRSVDDLVCSGPGKRHPPGRVRRR